MSPSNTRKSCFVIMPFGDKLNIDRRLIEALERHIEDETPISRHLTERIPFDKIHKYIIEKAARRLDLDCTRCDQIPGAGSIHEDMFRHIWQADVAIVDISTLNANVLYELGIRHTMHRKVTVLIQREGTQAPFNIQGYRVITYNEKDPESVDNTIDEIVKFVQAGFADEDEESDSPVYKHLPELAVGIRRGPAPLRIIETTQFHEYQVDARPHIRLGLVTGDIVNIKGVDVWVNSENRNMQMARFHDRSISGTIRWLGAKKKPYTNRVVEDTIAIELARIMGDDAEVDAGTVIPTGSGALRDSNQVKKVFHAAAVEGYLRDGYRPVPDVGPCVTHALALMDREGEADGLESIAFPLMGTGTGGGSIEDALHTLISRSLAYVKDNADTRIRRIYFLAPIDPILEAGRAILDATPGLSRIG